MALFGGYHLALDADDSTGIIAAYRPWHDGLGAAADPWPTRFLANHVPTMSEADVHDPRYASIADDEQAIAAGDVKTFAHIELDALEAGEAGSWLGRPYLAVLKLDVDRLGFLFGYGFAGDSEDESRATVGRFAALSRMTDLFFTGDLTALLARDPRFASAYTVYAGGDDMLLIGPWRQMVALARELRARFQRFAADNPNLTLSAGIELTRADQPLNRTVRAAEARLEAAKDAGRDRVSLIAEQPLPWAHLDDVLKRAERLSELVRTGVFGSGFLFRLRYFAEQRRLAEADDKPDIECADWRARWGYTLRRLVLNRRGDEGAAQALAAELNALLGLDRDLARLPDGDADAVHGALRVATDIALYRNRH